MIKTKINKCYIIIWMNKNKKKRSENIVLNLLFFKHGIGDDYWSWKTIAYMLGTYLIWMSDVSCFVIYLIYVNENLWFKRKKKLCRKYEKNYYYL